MWSLETHTVDILAEAVEDWECISNFIPHFTGHVITYHDLHDEKQKKLKKLHIVEWLNIFQYWYLFRFHSCSSEFLKVKC